nr:hypothetical protein [Kibdelosporangium sp. MJ126-NF4]CEL23495.1 hypothetical protein [Kibdelosporangium sp. MJ126-NF4]CTQ89109.1 hypothetical protein [Kibdelosporangium sp. MJ126-NF4]
MTSFGPNDSRHGKRPENGDEAQAVTTEPRDRPAQKATPKTRQPDARAEKARAPEAGVADRQTSGMERTRLFEETDVERYRVQWRELQAGFVDEPRATVREAETLVNHMVDSLTTQLNDQRQQLHNGAETDDTERLRVVMRKYRTLFDKLLAV